MIILNSGIYMAIQGRWYLKLTFELRSNWSKKAYISMHSDGVSLVMLKGK